jgi:branched-chain amino acid transport system ATP-binding protein
MSARPADRGNATAATPALAVRDLTVAFGGVTALDRLSFDVGHGALKAVIGPNGAGKTTLFNAISGFVAPRRGRIALDGCDVTAASAPARAARGLARTFQNLQLFPRLTVLENVMVGAHARLRAGWVAGLLGLAPREARDAEAMAYAELARLGLEAHAARRAGDLGFAEGKLVEIARALAASPRLLLLDEPIAGVPPAEQRRVADVVRAVHAAGTTGAAGGAQHAAGHAPLPRHPRAASRRAARRRAARGGGARSRRDRGLSRQRRACLRSRTWRPATARRASCTTSRSRSDAAAFTR